MSLMTYMLGIWLCGSATLFCIGVFVGAHLQRREYVRRWRKIEAELDDLEQRSAPYR
jgi:uncharacterized membrane protein